MANPTVNSGVPQAASLRSALWVSPDVDQSGTPTKGAWDALASAFWPVAGTPSDLTGVAVGTSGVNALACAASVDSGIFVESANNQTGNLWETYGNGPWSMVALVKAAATGLTIFQNVDGWSPNEGFSFFVDGVNRTVGLTMKGQSALVFISGGASDFAVDEIGVVAATFDPAGPTLKTYVNGTLRQTASPGGTYTPTTWASAERRAGFFDSDARTGAGHQVAGNGACGGLLFYSAVLTAAEIQYFGTSNAQALAGEFYSKAFTGLVSTTPVITGPTGAAGAASISHTVNELQNSAGTWSATDSVSWSLTGTDAADLSISVGGVVTKASGNFDRETKSSYSFNVVNGSASQAVTLTIANVNEAPTFSGTISVPSLTQGAAMTPVDFSSLFSDVDSGDTASYSQVGTWPAGVSIVGTTIAGTPTTAGAYANLRVRRTDGGGLTADSNLFTITVNSASVISGNITADDAAPTGTLSGLYGTITLPDWRNAAGDWLPSEPVARVTVQRLSDGVQVLNQAGLVTSSGPTNPNLIIAHAALVAGVDYLAISNNADGSALGVELVQAT